MANNELINSIVDAITVQIHSGKPYVTELDLSSSLQVSRTRLRESIQTLDTYGVITKRQKRGITLSPPERRDVDECYILREILEKLITDSVLEHVTDEDCNRLEEIDHRMMEALALHDYPALLRCDLEFHHAFIEIARMKIATKIVRNLHYLNYAYMAPLMTKIDDAPEKLITHCDIIDCLRKRDARCHKLLKKHINHSKKFLVRHCPQKTIKEIII